MPINYEPVNYQNAPSTATPRNAANLNKTDQAAKAACDGVDLLNANLGLHSFIQSGFIGCGALNGGPATTGDIGFPVLFSSAATPTIIITPSGSTDIRFVIKSFGYDGFSWDKYGSAGNYDGFFWIAFGAK